MSQKILFCILLLPLMVYSKVLQFNSCTKLQAVSVSTGDTVVISCDSAMILNINTFSIYHNAYQRLQQGNADVAVLINRYNKMLDEDMEKILKQDTSYSLFQGKFDSLVLNSLNFIKENSSLVTTIGEKLDSTRAAVDSSKKNVAEINSSINHAFIRNTLLWTLCSAGGFALGALFTLVATSI